MTYREKYKENERMLQQYLTYSQTHSVDTWSQNSDLVKPVDREDLLLLSEEIARLNQENRSIREAAIVNSKILDHEYIELTNSVTAQFDNAGLAAAH